MKKLRSYGLTAAILFGSLVARSQAGPAPMVIGAAGQAFTTQDLVLDWTVGEVAVTAWQPTGSPTQVLEGFQQGTWLPAVLADADAAAEHQQVTVYPNPFKTEVWVQAPTAVKMMQLEVYDLQGRQLSTLTKMPERGRVRLDLTELPHAGYVLRVSDAVSGGMRTTHFILKSN